MKKHLLFSVLCLFLVIKAQGQCTPVDCRPGVDIPSYGGVCSDSLPQGEVNQPVNEEVTIIIGGACFNTLELDSSINLGIVWVQSVFGFTFSGLPSGIDVLPNQTSYVAAGNDALGCVGVTGTPTEAGIFAAGIDFTVRVRLFPLGCGVMFLSGTVDLPFDFALELTVLPDASFAPLAATYCGSDAAVALNPTGTLGGSFSGPGVVGSSFDPSIAGPGIHEIIYTVSAQEGLAIAPSQNSSSQFVEVFASTIYYVDGDMDGYGDPNNFTETCDPIPPGTVENGDDCNDGNPNLNPDAEEICDGVDNDCDGDIDGDDDETLFAICQDVTVQLDGSGIALLPAASVNNGSLDACGTANFSVSPSGFTCGELGTNTATLTLTAGINISSCTATVIVEDGEPGWVTGDFGACSEPCGDGIQTRTVTCEDCLGNVLPDGSCLQPKPATTQTCNLGPCAIDCEVSAWSDWSECTVTCGGGTQTRTRTIITPPSNGGAPCPPLVETRPCNTDPCPIDCEVSAWSDWSECTVTCGGGTQTRTRTIITPPSNGGAPCPPLVETRPCNTDPCPIDCEVSDWSDWSECTVTCGGGTQTRTRTIITPPSNGGAPCPPLVETRPCNTDPCCESDWVIGDFGTCSEPCGDGIQTRSVVCQDCVGNTVPDANCSQPKPATTQTCNLGPCAIDCEVSAWSDWSECTVTCGGGTQTRTRTIITPPSNGGAPCPPLVETRPCNTDPCPIDCEVSDWSDWSECTVTCGGGTQTRTRTIITPPSNGGAPCPPLVETRPCNTDPCCESDWVIGDFGTCSEPCGDGIQTRSVVCQDCVGNTVPDANCSQPKPATTQTCNLGPCAIDCEVSAWSDWSECTVTCGGGTQTRTRTIITPPSNGGAPCPPLVETRPCNTDPCPVDCEVSDWSDWSECTVTCGGGTQTRTRTIITPPSNGGAPCPPLVETRPCNTDPCPIDCEVSEWSDWSECTVTCGGGTQTRTRTIITPPSNGGAPCPPLVETRPCNTDPCPVDCEVSAWSDWSECTVTCGGGTQTRTRTIITPPSNGGAPCPPLVETRPCNTDPCCESDWVIGDFGTCSEPCGDGIQTRSVVCQDCVGNTVPDANCSQPKPATTQTCNLGPCAIDCEVSAWSDWSECTVTCGGGTQTRTRTIITPPSNGGAPCPPLVETRPCNTDPCPIDCEVSDWSDWSECTVTCGGGTQTRTRTIITPPSNGGAPCPPLVETRPCNTDPCTDECYTPINLFVTDITFFQATLGWDAVPDAIRYQAEGRIKNSPFGITKRRIVAGNQFRTNVLFPFLTYQFRVRTDCPSTGWTGWSDWFDFTLNPFLNFNEPASVALMDRIPEIDLFDTENVISVFPNPTQGLVNVKYHNEILDGTRIRVTDISGRVFYELEIPEGENSTMLNLNKLENGLYLINFVKEGVELKTMKVFLSK